MSFSSGNNELAIVPSAAGERRGCGDGKNEAWLVVGEGEKEAVSGGRRRGER